MIFSKNIAMEFGIKKCGVLLMEKREEVSSYGVDLPNGLGLGLINNLYLCSKQG